jgi:hypothetical protein
MVSIADIAARRYVAGQKSKAEEAAKKSKQLDLNKQKKMDEKNLKIKQASAAKAKEASDLAKKQETDIQNEAARKAENELSLKSAQEEAEKLGAGLTDRANALSLNEFGLGDEDVAKREASRQDIFRQQQSVLAGQQGSQARAASDALNRRLQAGGLRGTGTAERLAQVQQKEISQQTGEQLAGLRLSQSEQEFAARDMEQKSRMGAQQYIDQSRQRASEMSASLVASGMEAERARIFADDQARKNEKFQTDVVLKMQSDQFRESMDMANKQFEFDKDISEFNKKMAEEMLKLNKEIVSQAGRGAGDDMFTSFWKRTYGKVGL